MDGLSGHLLNTQNRVRAFSQSGFLPVVAFVRPAVFPVVFPDDNDITFAVLFINLARIPVMVSVIVMYHDNFAVSRMPAPVMPVMAVMPYAA